MRLLGRTAQVWRKEGLNSCSYKTLSTERRTLYVNITVDIGTPSRHWPPAGSPLRRLARERVVAAWQPDSKGSIPRFPSVRGVPWARHLYLSPPPPPKCSRLIDFFVGCVNRVKVNGRRSAWESLWTANECRKALYPHGLYILFLLFLFLLRSKRNFFKTSF